MAGAKTDCSDGSTTRAMCRCHRRYELKVGLAMMALFGGFPSAVWTELRRSPRRTAGAQTRSALYQLWRLLIHVEQFGSPHCGKTAAAARQV